MNKDIDRFDNMPNKESMRGSHHKDGWDMKIYDQGRHNYKIVYRYIDKCFSKSIGKNFDKVKRHIYEKMQYHNIARNYDNIIEKSINWYIGKKDGKYIIDSQNRIQLNKEYIEKCKKWRDDRISGKLTIIDTSIEPTYRLREDITNSEINKLKNILINNGSYNKEFFNHISNGGIISLKKYQEFIYSFGYDDIFRGRFIYDTRKYVESCFSIYLDNVVYVFDEKSSEYIRYTKECSDSKRKIEREKKKEREEYNESLLFRLENNKKCREEEKNNIDRERLGFDEESFKGEPYHGQKRKKRKQ
jgi:hypothetical protein